MNEAIDRTLYDDLKEAPLIPYKDEPTFKTKDQRKEYISRYLQHGVDYAGTEGVGIAPEGWGESIYDNPNATPSDLQNIENYRAGEQNFFETLVTGAISRGASIIPKIGSLVGSLGGALYGAGNEILNPEEDNLKHVFDNIIVNGMSELDEGLRSMMPIYAGNGYDSESLLERMATQKFWFDDGFDALAYLYSASAPAKLVSGALKTIPVLEKAVQYGTNLEKTGNWVQKIAGKTLSELPDSIVTGINTIGESAMEAHEANKAIYENMAPIVGHEEAKRIASEGASNTLKANVAALILPNYVQSKFFSRFMAKPMQSDLRRAFLSGELTKESLKPVQSVLLDFGKGVASEGFFEENIQTSIQNYEQRMAAGEDPNEYGRLAGYAKGMIDNLSTGEGKKAIALGSIIGGGMGGFSAFVQEKRKATAFNNLSKYFSGQGMEDLKNGLMNFQLEKESILADDGSVDPDKFAEMFYRKMNDKKVFTEATIAGLNQDDNHAVFNNTMALARLFDKHVKMMGGDVDLAMEAIQGKFAAFGNDETKKATREATEKMESILSELKDSYSAINDGYTPAAIEGQASPEAQMELNMIKNAMFYNKAKVAALNSIKQGGKLTEKQEADINAVIADSEQRVKDLGNANTRKNILDRYKDQQADIKKNTVDLAKEVVELNKKETLDEADNKAINAKKYQNSEFYAIEGTSPITEFTINDMYNPKNTMGARHEAKMNVGKVVKERVSLSNELLGLANTINSSYDNRAIRNAGARLDALKAKADELGMDNDSREQLAKLEKAIEDKKVDMANKLANSTKEDSVVRGLLSALKGEAKLEDTFDSDGLDQLDLSEADYEGFLDANQTNQLVEYFQGKGQQHIIDNLSKTVKAKDGGVSILEALRAIHKSGLEDNISDKMSAESEEAFNSIGKIIPTEPKNFDNPEQLTDNALQEKVANEYIDDAIKSPLSAFNNNPDNFSDIPSVNAAERKLNVIKDFYESSEASDRENKERVLKRIYEALGAIQDAKRQAILNSQNRELADSSSTANRNDANRMFLKHAELLKAIEGIIGKKALDDVLDLIKDPSTVSAQAILDLLISKIKGAGKDKFIEEAKKAKKSVIDSFFSVLKSLPIYSVMEGKVDSITLPVMQADGTTLNTSFEPYFENPTRLFNVIVDMLVHGGIKDPTTSFAIDTFLIDRDPIRLLNSLKSNKETNLLSIDGDSLIKLLEFHVLVNSIDNAINMTESEMDIKAQIAIEEQFVAESKAKGEVYPSEQQIMSARQVVAWFKKSIGKRVVFKEFVYLRGLAGTGKTSLMIKLILKGAGIKIENVLVTAANKNATKTVNSSLGTTNEKSVNELSASDITDTMQVLVVDEIGALSGSELTHLRNMVYDVNTKREAAGKELLRVIVAGDPSQITKDSGGIAVVNGITAPEMIFMRDIWPLTIPFRSDESGINQAANVFHMNKREVSNVVLSHNKEDKHYNGSLLMNDATEVLKYLSTTKDSNRSRVIIVANTAAKSKYLGSDIPVLTYTEAQGMTVDEVFIDLPREAFPNSSEYNRAMYTMITRGVKLSTIVDAKGIFTNTVYDNDTKKATSNSKEYIKNAKKSFEEKRDTEKKILGVASKATTPKPAQPKPPAPTAGAQTSPSPTPAPVNNGTVEEQMNSVFGFTGDKAKAAGIIFNQVMNFIEKRTGKKVNVAFKKGTNADIDLNNKKIKKQLFVVNRVGDQLIAMKNNKGILLDADPTTLAEYKLALDMHERNESNIAIYSATGFIVRENREVLLFSPFIDAKNPFKNRLQAIKMVDNKIPTTTTVDEFFNLNEDLVNEIYGDILKKIRIEFKKSDNPREYAVYHPVEGKDYIGIITINLNNYSDYRDMLFSLIHEIQHGVQDVNDEMTEKKKAVNKKRIVKIVKGVLGNEYTDDEAFAIGDKIRFETHHPEGSQYNEIHEQIYALEIPELEANWAAEIAMYGKVLSEPRGNGIFQSSETGEVYGAMEMDKSAMEAIIYAFEKGDIHTLAHELGHIVEEFLTEEEKQDVLDWFYSDNQATKEWTPEVSEAFAVGLERFLYEGKSPNTKLEGLFKQLSKWIGDIYANMLNALGIELNDKMRNIYSSIFIETVEEAPTEPLDDTSMDNQGNHIPDDDDGSNESYEAEEEEEDSNEEPTTEFNSDDFAVDDITITEKQKDKVDLLDFTTIDVSFPDVSSLEDLIDDVASSQDGVNVVLLRLKNENNREHDGIGVFTVAKTNNGFKYTRVGVLSSSDYSKNKRLQEANHASNSALTVVAFNSKVIQRTSQFPETAIIASGKIKDVSKINFQYKHRNEDGSINKTPINSMSSIINMYNEFIKENGYDDYYISKIEYRVFNKKEIEGLSLPNNLKKSGFMFQEGHPYVFITASAPGKKSFTHFVIGEQPRMKKDNTKYREPLSKFYQSLNRLEESGLFGKSGGYKFAKYAGINQRFVNMKSNDDKLKTIIKYVANSLFTQGTKDKTLLDQTRDSFNEVDVQNIKELLDKASINSDSITLESLNQFINDILEVAKASYGYSNEKVSYNSIESFEKDMTEKGFTNGKDDPVAIEYFLKNANDVSVFMSPDGDYYVYKKGIHAFVKVFDGGFQQSKTKTDAKSNFKYNTEWRLKGGAGYAQHILNKLATSNNKVNGRSLRQTTKKYANKKHTGTLLSARQIISPINLDAQIGENSMLPFLFREKIITPALQELEAMPQTEDVQFKIRAIKAVSHPETSKTKAMLISDLYNMIDMGILDQAAVSEFIQDEMGENDGSALLKDILESEEVRMPIPKNEYNAVYEYSETDSIGDIPQNNLVESNLQSMNGSSLQIELDDSVQVAEEITEEDFDNPFGELDTNPTDGFLNYYTEVTSNGVFVAALVSSSEWSNMSSAEKDKFKNCN